MTGFFLKVLSELWVLQEKVGMKVSAFSLTKYFLFLGIYGIIELSKDEQIEVLSNTRLFFFVR